MRCTFARHLLMTTLLLLVGVRDGSAEPVSFNRDIRPILSQKCFQCHGPDDESREADLRLDVADDADGPFADRGDVRVIAPHDPRGSLLWQRVTTNDADHVMPPPQSNLDRLSEVERDLVERWIAEGAEYDAYWAFVSPDPQPLPSVTESDWNRNRVDQFVMAKLETLGKHPQTVADRRTLIRRVTFDLTGLPPTVAEIRQFLADRSPSAYERLVERLLSSPRYGEHMARYWLDLVRFADTNGIHHDHYREMTPYRDWVVRSFNENLRFDKFVVDQIAGDLYPQPTTDELIASGFNRLHLVIDRGTAIPKESFTRNVVDRVTAVGTAFMGLTVGCAVCHDHKYDPITQEDFYQLFAFFNNIDAEPETPGRGVHPPFIRLPNADQESQLKAIRTQLAEAERELERRKQTLQQTPSSASSEDQADAISDSDVPPGEEELKRIEQARDALKQQEQKLLDVIPISLVMKEREEIRPAHILIRGVYDQPGRRVERGTPSFLPELHWQGEYPTRMDLAKWLTHHDHPLTARVTVNRIWQQFFGVGLVKTSEDFGTQGEWPSHPALLDDLTTNFIVSGWDVKALVKVFVCSQTYQQSSAALPGSYRDDPENRMLARGSRFRLDAESIRDQILAVSGLLHQSMYGRSVKPPQPPGLWKTVSMVSSSTYAFTADEGAKRYRRSLYSFWKRALPPPQMTIFDAPTRESCTARRERTNTPLQALVLMNEDQYFRAAHHLAHRLVAEDSTDEERLKGVFETLTSHRPDAEELEKLQSGLASLRSTYANDPKMARELTAGSGASDEECIEIAAYTMLVNSLFNLDVTKTRE